MPEVVPVNLAERSYDIVIGSDLLADTGKYLSPHLSSPRVAVLVDEQVQGLHLGKLLDGLKQGGIKCDWRPVPAGERAKSWRVLKETVEWLLEIGVERRDLVIAFGGGVTGDLAGFAAAVTRRGVRYVQIPTTLLAQVDSSVGGKTGINSESGKNLVGSFHQPSLVLCDTGLLETLPARAMRSGYGEVAKYGLLGDAAFFAWLEKHGEDVVGGDSSALITAVRRSCELKAEIVALDETEQGCRALLNLGHTFGHAFETDTGYSEQLLHGEAVSLGCCLAFDLSEATGLVDADSVRRVRAHYDSLSIATDIKRLPFALSPPERLIELMRQDKKVIGGRIRFVLAREIGRAIVAEDVDLDAVREVLARSARR